jgi:catechol 2,3-dioxygenase-like lactoylglutathione lyase family enzyme
VRRLLDADPHLARAAAPYAPHCGWTGLHAAAQAGQRPVVDLLIARGADVLAREEGDNTTALHWAAARGDAAIVRALVDAGGDVHGLGDVHALDVIGWAAFFREPGTPDITVMEDGRRACIDVLVERGARHHIFSAICVGDLALITEIVEQNRNALDRRMSRFERGLSALHFAIARKRYDVLDLLLSLGAGTEMTDGFGQTALTVAMLHHDLEAMRRLRAAGAKPPDVPTQERTKTDMAERARTVRKGVPMIKVPDIARTLDWYVSIGFRELGRYENDGIVNFGIVSFGGAELMLNIHGTPGVHDTSLWFYTDAVDELYTILKSRQLAAVQAALNGETVTGEIVFVQEIEDMFYGARQFGIQDPNGYELYFIQDAPQ